MVKNNKSAENQWSRNWDYGHLTSLPTIFSSNYDGSIVEFWHGFLGTRPAQTRILDLATGNGAIAVIAESISNKLNKKFDIHAADQARINPGTAPNGFITEDGRPSTIHYYPNTPADCMPFPDGFFDTVIGQYGLEYTNLGPTLNEIHRILSADGQAGFILHNKHSAILKTSRDEKIRAKIIGEELQLFKKLKNTLRHKQRGNLLTRKKAQQELRACVRELSNLLHKHPKSPTLNNAIRLVQAITNEQFRISVGQQNNMINNFIIHTDKYLSRLDDLFAAAEQAEGPNMTNHLKHAGFRIIEFAPLYYKKDILIGSKLHILKI